MTLKETLAKKFRLVIVLSVVPIFLVYLFVFFYVYHHYIHQVRKNFTLSVAQIEKVATDFFMSEEKSFIYMLDRIFKRLAAEPNKFEHFLANSLASYGLDDLNRYTLEQIPVSHVPDCVRDRLRSPVDYLLEKKLTKDGIFT